MTEEHADTPTVLATTNVTWDSTKGHPRLWVPRMVVEDAELESGETVFWIKSDSGKIVGVPASQIEIAGEVP